MQDNLGQRPHTHPPVLDEAGLVGFLETQLDIVAAYLFGSLAQGRTTPRSDVDIAVLLGRIPEAPGAITDRRLELIDGLRRFADRHIDVIILNTAPVILQQQVLRTGRLLHERDILARVDFEVRSGQDYADLKPGFDFFTRMLVNEIKEVGLGGRR